MDGYLQHIPYSSRRKQKGRHGVREVLAASWGEKGVGGGIVSHIVANAAAPALAGFTAGCGMMPVNR